MQPVTRRSARSPATSSSAFPLSASTLGSGSWPAERLLLLPTPAAEPFSPESLARCAAEHAATAGSIDVQSHVSDTHVVADAPTMRQGDHDAHTRQYGIAGELAGVHETRRVRQGKRRAPADESAPAAELWLSREPVQLHNMDFESGARSVDLELAELPALEVADSQERYVRSRCR